MITAAQEGYDSSTLGPLLSSLDLPSQQEAVDVRLQPTTVERDGLVPEPKQGGAGSLAGVGKEISDERGRLWRVRRLGQTTEG